MSRRKTLRPLRPGWFRHARRTAGSLARDAVKGWLRSPASGGGLPTDADERRARLAAMGARMAKGMGGARLRTVGAGAERRREVMEHAAMRSTRDVLDTLGDMKGAVMKIAQMASFAVDGLPPDVQQQLAVLQKAAPPMSYELVCRVVEQELGTPPSVAFARFEHVPLAAASIGQVHRAVTHDGREVAVKVQYPGVDEAVLADLQNADMIFSTVAAMFGGFDARALLEEVVARMSEEFDYKREAANQMWFADRYRNHPYVRIPEVVAELSTSRVLTTELVEGRGFYEVLGEPQDVRNRWGEIMFRFSHTSIYADGVFTADPHPGNYIFCGDGRICFLDFGLVKRLSADERDRLRAPARAMLTGDRTALLEAARGLGVVPKGSELDPEDVWTFFSALSEAVASDEPYRYTRRKVGDMLRRVFMPGGEAAHIQQHLELPAMLAMFNRYMIGGMAVLGHLEAEGNWQRIVRESLLDEPPSTPMGCDWGQRREP